MIVLACSKLPPHIWELMIRLQRGRADPFPDLRIGSRGFCVGHDPVSTCDGWRAPMAGARPFPWEHSRGVVLEEILVMGIDCRPC